MPSGMLLDVAKYLGSLQYNVWKKMLDIITVGEVLGPPQGAVVPGLKREAAPGVLGAGEERGAALPAAGGPGEGRA